MTALFVNHRALLVHHIIVFEEALTDTKVVFFHLLLRTFDAGVYHRRFEHFTFLEAEFVHHLRNLVTTIKTHELVFE